MSVESFNPENRINVNVNMSRAQVLRNIARTRHCSYCHQEGHTIRTCNDERLINFENICNLKKTEFIVESQLNVNLSKIKFRHWLLNYSVDNISIIKAYSVSKCGTTLRDNLAFIIDKITNYIYRMELEEGELDDIPDLIDPEHMDPSETDDFIPFQATQEVSEADVRLFMAISTMLNLNDNTINPNLIQELYYSAIIQTHLSNQKYKSIKIISTAEELTTAQIHEDLYSKCECNICYENMDKYTFVKLNCNHEFCKDCVIKTIKTTDTYKEPCCAFCRTNIDSITTQSDEIKAELDYLFT